MKLPKIRVEIQTSDFLVLHFIIICRVFRAASASSLASPVAGSYAGYRRLLAYKVLETASVSCKAAGSPFALFFGCQPCLRDYQCQFVC